MFHNLLNRRYSRLDREKLVPFLRNVHVGIHEQRSLSYVGSNSMMLAGGAGEVRA